MAKWVRVEHGAEGDLTGYQEFDVERVQRIQVGRKGGKIEALFIFYKDEPGMAIRLDSYAAEAFLKVWDELRGDLIRANEEPAPGVIQVVGESLPRIMG